MPKLSWNKFTQAHSEATCFGAAVSGKLPGGPHMDDKGQFLPTPYNLLQELFTKLVNADWCSKKIKGGALFKVSDHADTQAIIKAIGANPITPPRMPGCRSQFQLAFTDSEYARFAKILGYKIR